MRCWVFDVDDTIVEYVDFDFEEWYEFVAKPAAEQLKIPMSVEIWRAMIEGKISRKYPERFGVQAKEFWKKVDENNLKYRERMWGQRRIRASGNLEFLKRVDGIKIAWSASSSECANYVLEKTKTKEEFEEVFGKDYNDYQFLGDGDPKEEMLKEIKRKYNCEECYVIGDSERDMNAARAAGCTGLRKVPGKTIGELVESVL